MLRITIEEKDNAVVLRLEGQLIGPWVEEVEQCWRNVFTTVGERSVQVDLSAVSFMDTAGGALLHRMHDAGFRVAGGAPVMEKAWRDKGEALSRAN
jgi:anti-anti-sigma factor